MKHAILILAHNDIDFLLRLIDYFDSDFYIYIHIDKKSLIRSEEIESLQNRKNVVLVSQSIHVNWGGMNVLKAELLLLKKASEDRKADYYHLISGQDYPTVPLKEFKLFFQKNAGKEFLEYNTLPRKEWDNGTFRRIEYFATFDLFNYRTPRGKKWINLSIRLQERLKLKRKMPKHFNTLYGGSAWFSITKEALAYLVNYTNKKPSFLRRLNYTFAPDEIYILTILVNSHFRKNIVNNNLRYIIWRFRNGSYPAILDDYDYYDILSSGCLFARKIVMPASAVLIKKIEKRIFA